MNAAEQKAVEFGEMLSVCLAKARGMDSPNQYTIVIAFSDPELCSAAQTLLELYRKVGIDYLIEKERANHE